jgi:hypothetical protein
MAKGEFGKELRVTTIAADAEKLRELDEDTRRAWESYQEKTRDLAGSEYDEAELDAWTDLQEELRRVERRRKLMSTAAD